MDVERYRTPNGGANLIAFSPRGSTDSTECPIGQKNDLNTVEAAAMANHSQVKRQKPPSHYCTISLSSVLQSVSRDAFRRVKKRLRSHLPESILDIGLPAPTIRPNSSTAPLYRYRVSRMPVQSVTKPQPKRPRHAEVDANNQRARVTVAPLHVVIRQRALRGRHTTTANQYAGGGRSVPEKKENSPGFCVA